MKKLHLDGLARDLERMKREIQNFVWPAWRTQDLPRFSLRFWEWPHLTTALATTLCRYSYYTGGHVIMVLLVIAIVGWIL